MQKYATMNRANEKCATCGHDRRQHIYEEGACRPGFICDAHCEEFKAVEATPQPLPFKISKPGDYVMRNCQRVTIDYNQVTYPDLDSRVMVWVGRVWVAGQPNDTNQQRWKSDGTNLTGETAEARDRLKIVAHWEEPKEKADPVPFAIAEPGRYVLANGDSVNLEKLSAHLWTALVWDEGAKSMLRHRWITSGRNLTGNTLESRDKLQVIARFPEPRDLRADIRTPDAVAQIQEIEVLKQIDEAKKAYSSGLAHRQHEAVREQRVFAAAIQILPILSNRHTAEERVRLAVAEAETLVAEIEKTRERRKVLFK